MHYKILAKTMFLALALISLLSTFSACKQSILNEDYSSSNDYKTMAWNDAIKAGISPQLFVNQIQVESGFNPQAQSYAGAIGIAQILPSTAAGWNVDPWDPVASLKAAANAMAWYQNKYGSYEKALACYNAGCGRLEWAIQNCLNFYWCLPEETQRYINKIMG